MKNSNLKKEKKQFFNKQDKKLLKEGLKWASTENEIHFLKKDFLKQKKKKDYKKDHKENINKKHPVNTPNNEHLVLIKEIVLLLDSINQQFKSLKRIIHWWLLTIVGLLLFNFNKTSQLTNSLLNKTKSTVINRTIRSNNIAPSEIFRDVIIFLVIGLVIIIIIKWLARKSEKW